MCLSKFNVMHWQVVTVLVHEVGEGLEFQEESLIREESVELDVPAEEMPDNAGYQDQAEEEKENSLSTDQHTQDSEVFLIRRLSATRQMEQL